MDQGLEGSSIRNSHREIHAVRGKPAPKHIAEKARALVDRCSQSGTVIRQHLDLDRMKVPLQKGTFYVIENDGNSEPGFLVFLPGQQAPVYLHTTQRGPHPITLRMRVSPVLGEGGGSVFIATLDTIQHKLRIEDVWMWKGLSVFDTDGYSKRREYLREFVERYWVPDARLLGGIVTSILNPKSISEFLEGVPNEMIELLPESPGRRRIRGTGRPPRPLRGTTITHPLGGELSLPLAPCPKQNATVLHTSVPLQRVITHPRLRAVPVDKMPDIYDLYDEKGLPVTRAPVQLFSLSQMLRNKKGEIWVTAEWRENFNGYEITKVL